MSETEQKDGTCCPNCFHKKRYSGDQGMVDVCVNADCACHNTLTLNVGEQTGVRDRMGGL